MLANQAFAAIYFGLQVPAAVSVGRHRWTKEHGAGAGRGGAAALHETRRMRWPFAWTSPRLALAGCLAALSGWELKPEPEPGASITRTQCF